MKTYLVTGGAGFIGSNYIHYILEKHVDIKVVNLDDLTYGGSVDKFNDLDDERYIFAKGDITDRLAVEDMFAKYDFDYVVNLAAETHVDKSIENPEVFLRTNILGTQVLLDVAKHAWQIGKDSQGYPKYKEGVKFLQVSTDEVYGSLGKMGLCSETTPLAPNSPYSASKASADMMVRAYRKTYKLPVNITRSSNNYGPYQFPEKLIPLMLNNAKNDKQLPVYGNGKQIRDWLYVKDHCVALDMVLIKAKTGEVYNIGGNNQMQNIEVIKLILQYLAKPESLIKHVRDRQGHDTRYAVDTSKIKRDLGWEPSVVFADGIVKTIDWYLNNEAWLKTTLNDEYKNNYNSIYKDR